MNSFEIIKKQISNYMSTLSLELSENQYIQIYRYYQGLVEWNQVMNLTAITDEIEFSQKHVMDSVLIHRIFDMNKVESLIDIGTGAGLPGLVLKIVFPHINVLLVDSLHKRISFLSEMIEVLGLENIVAIQGRAEDMGKDMKYREQYDVCVSRAVSQLPILSEYCLPFVKLHGNFIAYKSITTDEEIKDSYFAVDELGGSIKEIKDIELIEGDIMRRFVVIDKVNETIAKYPRKAGIPQKRPLMK